MNLYLVKEKIENNFLNMRIAYSTKPSVGNREFTLAGGEDLEKELEHFRNRCQEVEQENSVLSTKIRDFERNARLLTSEYKISNYFKN